MGRIASNVFVAGSQAATAGYVEDIFSTYLYTGNGSGNFIENGINLGNANSSGSAYFDGTGDYLSIASNSAFDLGTGDFTVECWVYRTGTSAGYETMLGFDVTGGLLFELYNNQLDYGIRATQNNTSGTTVPSFQWVHLALARQSGTVRYFQNGSLIYTYTGAYATQNLTNNSAALISSYSPGVGVFNGYISNLRLVKGTALYVSSFTPSTSQLTAVSGTSLLLCQGNAPFIDNSVNAFSVTKFGDSAAKEFGPFTGTGVGKGGLVWLKNRTNSGDLIHHLWDSNRGAAELNTASTAAQGAFGGNPTFQASGFVDNYGWTSSQNIVSWTFRKQPKFFDVVTYTGNGTNNRQITHNLGAVPGCIIVKAVSQNGDWGVYHRSLANDTGLILNQTSAAQSGIYMVKDMYTSTSSYFVVSAPSVNSDSNTNGVTYVAYLFAHDAGGFGASGSENVISCGSFTTGTSGKISAPVNLGYEVQWLLVKNISASENWQIYDVMRGMPVSDGNSVLYPNLSNAEYFGSTSSLAPTATGFDTPTAAGPFANSSTYIYIAIRRGPMKTPTTGTSVYNAIARTGTGAAATVSGVGFPPDFLFNIDRLEIGVGARYNYDRLRGAGQTDLRTNSTAAEGSAGAAGVSSFDMNGFSITSIGASFLNNSAVTYINYFFRRAPGFFDEVCYTGTQVNRTLNHNLSVVPELIIQKSRAPDPGVVANRWLVGTNFTASNYRRNWLELTDSGTTYTYAAGAGFSAQPTATTFSITDNYNISGTTYVAYLFATCPGVSKVGSYTGTGNTLQIDCGFTGGARFVLIKRTDSTGDWYVWDSARGIVAGNDPYLLLNSTAAEVTTTDWVDIYSPGFELSNAGGNNVNINTASYIFLAIA